MRNFKQPQMQCAYLVALFNPPTIFVGHKQCQYRRTGSSWYYPFWQGFDGLKVSYAKTSFSYAVYCAGIDYKKFNGKDYPKT